MGGQITFKVNRDKYSPIINSLLKELPLKQNELIGFLLYLKFKQLQNKNGNFDNFIRKQLLEFRDFQNKNP